MFYNTKYLLLSILALFCISMVSAPNIIDEWTFTDGVAPQTSDILEKSMGNWDAALAGTSVPSAGLLRDATGGNSSGAFWGDNLGLEAMPDNVVLTVEILDINHTQRDYWFEFLGNDGTSNDLRLDINAFNGGIVIDLWGAGTKYYDGPGPIFDTDDYTGAISLTVTATWDFANNTLSYTLSGDGVGYTGAGSSAFSDTQTVSGDLSAITNIKSMRVRGGTVGAGEYIVLDKVTIATMDNTPPEAPVISNATETTVTGTAEANSTITVYGEDGTTVLDTGTTDGSGNFTVNFTTAQLPCTTIKVSAKDASNNESQKTDGTLSTSDTPILRTALLYSCFPARLQNYVDTNPDEAQKGIIDVTLSPYNAAGNGVADDTQAIQDAIDDAYLYNFAVHLPANNIFLVSQQLRLITTTESRRYGHQFIGDANGAKPIIRLADGSGLGGNGNYDDALIRFQYNNGEGGTEESKHYTATFRNIDIDMGNNPDATALTMAGAQHCVIEDIKIYGEAFNVGIQDLPGSGGSTVNVHIIGGNIGIDQAQNRTVPH